MPPISEAWLVLIGQGLTLLTAICAAILGYYNKQAIATTQAKVQEVHLTVDSRLDQLVAKSEALAHTAGFVEGKREGRAEAVAVIKTTDEQKLAAVDQKITATEHKIAEVVEKISNNTDEKPLK